MANKFSCSETSNTTANTSGTGSDVDVDTLDLYEDMDASSKRQDSKAHQERGLSSRRGGVLFKDNSKYHLQSVKYADAKKGILKVASLEDSLRAATLDSKLRHCRHCLPKEDPRRASLTLENITDSLSKLFVDDSNTNNGQNKPETRGCFSMPTGMDLSNCHESVSLSDENGKIIIRMSATAADSMDCCNSKTVQFADILVRQYPVAPDDNPSVSGKGSAIALSGWRFKTVPAVTVEDYESTRGPRKTMEDLKLDMVERRVRLKEHGASSKEIAEFGRRVQKAKLLRQETVQAAKTYGKSHEQRAERTEKVGRFFQRAFGLRKTDSKRLAALWDEAQQQPKPSAPAIRARS